MFALSEQPPRCRWMLMLTMCGGLWSATAAPAQSPREYPHEVLGSILHALKPGRQLVWERTANTLPWQHVIVFRKK